MAVHSTGEGPTLFTVLELSHAGDCSDSLTIEYCTGVRRSCAGRETMANDNPYYCPKGTLSIVMSGHWTSSARVYFHRSNRRVARFSQKIMSGFMPGKKGDSRIAVRENVTTTNTLRNLFFIVYPLTFWKLREIQTNRSFPMRRVLLTMASYWHFTFVVFCIWLLFQHVYA